MAREDQMEALYEFFGGTAGQNSTSPSSTFSTIQSVVKGEPLDILSIAQPCLFILAPTSKETRFTAKSKFVTYTLTATLVHIYESGTNDDEGPAAINNFYSIIDSIANKIRTNKQLVTASYPNGASVKFGETFDVTETHERIENAVFLIARFSIESIEQVIGQ